MVNASNSAGSRSFAAPVIHPYSNEVLYELLGKRPSSSKDLTEDRTRYFHKYLSDLAAATIVVEYDYVDGDYLDDYASYYVKCFSDYGRRCQRLHFFSAGFTEPEFLNAVRDPASPLLETLYESYLGFLVVRPLPEATIGRTVLKAYKDDDRRRFPCVRKYRVNLFGLEFTLDSLAYQEQDEVLAACATVSLWCSFSKTTELFGSASPTPAEITNSATNVIYFSRSTPSAGLKVQQMCSAIRHVGLEPEVLPIKQETPLASLVYSYVKMGLPTILGVEIEGRGPHAITVAGYSMRGDISQEERMALPARHLVAEQTLPTVARSIDRFYCHDDQIGPFSRIWIKSPTQEKYPLEFEGSWRDASTETPLRMRPLVAIIPVYNKIRINFLDVHKWLMRIHLVFRHLLDERFDLEWKLYLTTSNGYKAKLRRAQEIDRDFAVKICLNPHPRFLWRALLKSNGNPLVEFLIDATGIAAAVPMYQAIWFDEFIRTRLNELLLQDGLSDSAKMALRYRLWESMVKCSEHQLVTLNSGDFNK
ncbi:MAG TPA: hypothetical protein VI306_09930 [Pyrinomonadaceae bacterium]